MVEPIGSAKQIPQTYPDERIKRLIIRELVRRDDCVPDWYPFAFWGVGGRSANGRIGGKVEITMSDFRDYILEFNIKVPSSIMKNKIENSRNRQRSTQHFKPYR
jgi:hypothetical protein